MRQTPNRCDQILDLIDACLRELVPTTPASTPAYATVPAHDDRNRS
jgi:hypothetical protein